MHAPTPFLALSALLCLPFTRAICNSGEIGIGPHQFCELGNELSGATCQAQTFEIYDTDCVSHDRSMEDTICGGEWANGSEVLCDGEEEHVEWIRRGESFLASTQLGRSWYKDLWFVDDAQRVDSFRRNVV